MLRAGVLPCGGFWSGSVPWPRAERRGAAGHRPVPALWEGAGWATRLLAHCPHRHCEGTASGSGNRIIS